MRPLSALLVLSTVLAAAPARAADLHVAPGGSIQAAIVLAADGDRVLVAPGTYVEQLDLLGKAIEVIGLGGAGQTVLDSGGPAPVVRFASGEGPATRLQGFTVTGGHASVGAGGLTCGAGARPTIEDCIVRGNTGRPGGGIGGSPILRRCVIRDNTSSLNHGGGIFGAPDMTFCVVASNTATSAHGGGVYFFGGAGAMRDCVVVENGAVFANSRGGGVYVDSTASVAIERTVIAYNFATGGVFAGLGGGVFVEAGGSSMVGGVVVDNSLSGSSLQGGGVYGPLAITNSIVRDNVGPQLTSAGPVRYSDIQGGAAGVGNVDLDPAFVDAALRDWHLTASSPLIDLGDPALLDPDGSRSDIGAFPFQMIYTRANTDPDDWAAPGWPEVSVLVGGRQELVVLAGRGFAARPYQVLGSASGTSPGVVLGGVTLPLVGDAYFRWTLRLPAAPFALPGAPTLSPAAGLLDSDGRATVTVALAPGLTSGLAGTVLHHAAVVYAPASPAIELATGAEPLALVP